VKNAYIHDGAGWQSLKGPPGPSEPSKDAGNTITVGSDGLLMLKGDTQFSGSWTPLCDADADGYWTRAGRAVTLTISLGVRYRDEGDAPDRYGIGGLPFSVAEFYDDNLSALSALFGAPVVSAAEKDGVIGSASMNGSSGDEVSVMITAATGDTTACINITYLTDDARIG
jgi:hypothetical protein